MTFRSLSLCLVALSAAVACGGPAAPFDTLKDSSVVAYRLQNFEPPPAAQQPGAPLQPGQIPGIPPEIQQWAQQALPGLQQMIPPGLIPPGLIPGLPAQPAPVPPPQAQVPRFHGFRILEQQPVVDSNLKEELGELLGDEDSFQTQHSNCLYAEMGLSFTNTHGAPTNDVLISFSCNQMQGHNFVWPHPHTGATPKTVKKLSDIVSRLFPPQVGVQPQPVAIAGQPVIVL